MSWPNIREYHRMNFLDVFIIVVLILNDSDTTNEI